MNTIYCFSLDKMFASFFNNVATAINSLTNKDFEYFWKRGLYRLVPLTKGGFGAIYELEINGHKVVDRKQADVIVKMNNNGFKQSALLFEGVWLLDFDLAEIYFCPFISYLNKMKVCPFLCNYISANIVDKDYVLFIERYSYEVMTFLPHLTVDYVIQFLFQLTYSFYIIKQYLGMVHFDVHLRNVMVAKSTSSFLLADPNKKRGIYLPHMAYEARLIDFGFCTMDLRHSIDPHLRGDFQCAPHNFSRTPAISELFKTTRDTRSKLLTVEIQYFCLHLYQIIARQAPQHPILKAIQQFCDCMYDQVVDLTQPALQPGRFILPQHDVGVVCASIRKPSDLIVGLERYCHLYGSVIYDKESDLQISTPFKNTTVVKENAKLVLNVNKLHVYKNYQNFIKTSIPDIRWFESTFTVIENTYGHVYKFPINCWVDKISSDRSPYNAISIFRKDVPYNIRNAYLTHHGARVTFHVNRRTEDFSNSFYAGKFLFIKGTLYACEHLPPLMFGLSDDYFCIFSFKSDKCKYVEKIIQLHHLNYLIDASNACGFHYQGDPIYGHTTTKKPLFYISINDE